MTNNRQTLILIVLLSVLVFYTSVPDGTTSSFLSGGFSSFFDHEAKPSAFAKGIVFMVVSPDDDDAVSAAAGDLRGGNSSAARFAFESARAVDHSAFSHADQIEACVAHVAKRVLPDILVRSQPQAMQFVAAQLARGTAKRHLLEALPHTAAFIPSTPFLSASPSASSAAAALELLDVQHEQWVVRPWQHVEREFSALLPRESGRVLRALAACLRGGGLGADRPHSADHWAQRGGTDRREHHPFFFPLHGAVSPRRVVKQALRAAEYLGVPTPQLRAADNGLIARMRMPRRLDLSAYSLQLALRPASDPDAVSITGGGGGAGAAVDSVLRRLVAGLVGERRGGTAGGGDAAGAAAPSGSAQSQEPSDNDLVQAVTEAEETRMRRHEEDEAGSGGEPLADLDSTTAAGGEPRTATKVLVDLGGGHGAMLAAMCPPHPRLWCYGIDATDALVRKARRAFPHIDYRAGVAAPHLPTGSADAVLSNGVMGVIRFSHNCAHLQEILRLLRPGRGVAVLWQLSTTQRWARFHPSFFGFDEELYLGDAAARRGFIPAWRSVAVDPSYGLADLQAADEDLAAMLARNNSSKSGVTSFKPASSSSSASAFSFRRLRADKIFTRCPNKLWRYLARVDIIADDPHTPLYTPKWDLNSGGGAEAKGGGGAGGPESIRHWAGTFGVRLFRNRVKFVPGEVLQERRRRSEAWRDRRDFARQDAAAIVAAAAGASTAKGRRRQAAAEIGASEAAKKHVTLDADTTALAAHIGTVLRDYSSDRHSFKLPAPFPQTLHPPEGLRVLMAQRKNTSSSSSSASSWFDDTNPTLRKVRRDEKKVIDLALKCEFFDKRSKTWCPEGRAMLP